MTINQAPLKKKLLVKSFPDHETKELSGIESRLMHLGFISGQEIKVTKKAAFFQEPLLVEVRGRSVALTAQEASLVEVEVIE